MKWDAFTIVEQLLILLSIASQVWIAIKVILASEGAEQYVRIMAYSTGILMFLITRAFGMTFADLMLIAYAQQNVLNLVVIGVLMPLLMGVLVSEVTIIALKQGAPVLIRVVLMVGAFTVAQVAYTNYVAIASRIATLDKAFIPNLCYAISVGLWLTFRYRDKTAMLPRG